MKAEIRGSVERVVFYNPDNYYAVIKLNIEPLSGQQPSGQEDLVTVTGNFAQVHAGQMLRIEGKWEQHPKYGNQLKAANYEILPIHSAQAIERYLASGLVKGIGPVMAKKIVRKFGAETMKVLDDDPSRLSEVGGIGSKKIAGLKRSLKDQKELKEMMIAFQEYEISPAYAMKIYKQYGGNSIEVLKANPYRLAEEVSGIGFIKADAIASRTGIPKDSPFRAEAGILYMLERLSDEGHVYYPYDRLVDEAEKALSIPGDNLVRAAASLRERGKIIIDKNAGGGNDNTGAVYLKDLHDAETDVASGLKTFINAKGGIKEKEISEAVGWVQKELPFGLSQKQVQAVKGAVSEKAFIITGGPGVGKTTIVKAILKIYKRCGKKVLLAAPTGRAAKRLSELSLEDAKTIHRLLEYTPAQGFRRNRLYPIDADLVILDESSMIDTNLMARMMAALPPKCGLIMVGDSNQLPSVGPGNVLGDMIASGTIPTERLDEIFRQSKESMIVVNAHKINSGEMPFFHGDDFHFLKIEESQSVLEKIVELCTKTLPARGFDPFRDIQVLSPMHKGVLGVSNLNRTLQAALNKTGEQNGIFRTLDKVMQTRNNYEKDVFNGDIGRIMEIKKGAITVNFYGRHVGYTPSETEELQLAYAASVHKSQGSEYPAVVMPVVTEHFMLLQRNLLYTAVTRAKRLMMLLGQPKALAISVKNSKTALRHTALKKRLSES
ncbi:MAG: ATP-dependent RecD-like DNA helicase [Nitrospiraceae bacterium]|nr:ATP-dependent RecD-like DNA helicase [Nitrospiraceae bacterium]